jgi:hypothetical protein
VVGERKEGKSRSMHAESRVLSGWVGGEGTGDLGGIGGELEGLGEFCWAEFVGWRGW